MLDVAGFDPRGAVANALSTPPGEYGRKAKNSKELTGARTSGGACGLIRRNAQNLTWARKGRNPVETRECSQESRRSVLHGCRQLVS